MPTLATNIVFQYNKTDEKPLADRRARNINEELVKQSAAWVYEEYISNPSTKAYWLALEQDARKNKRGLWNSSRPIRPKMYRKNEKLKFNIYQLILAFKSSTKIGVI